MPPDERVVTVFISYAHEDRRWCDLLLDQLGALVNLGQIRAFDDSQIAVGTTWEPTIKQELETAEIIVLIITAKFMRSKYCTTVELTHAVERHLAGTGRVIPIVADYVDVGALPLGSLQMLPVDENRDLKPLSEWKDDVQRPLAQIARCIREAVEKVKNGGSRSIPPVALRAPRVTTPRTSAKSLWVWTGPLAAIAILLVLALVILKPQMAPQSSAPIAPPAPQSPPADSPAVVSPQPSKETGAGTDERSRKGAPRGPVQKKPGATPGTETKSQLGSVNPTSAASGPTGSRAEPTPAAGPAAQPASVDQASGGSTVEPTPPAGLATAPPEDLFTRAKRVIDCVVRTKDDAIATGILSRVFKETPPDTEQGRMAQLRAEFGASTVEQQSRIVSDFHCLP